MPYLRSLQKSDAARVLNPICYHPNNLVSLQPESLEQSETAPAPKALLDAARDFEAVKNHLVLGDKATYIPSGGEPLEMNLTVRWNLEDIEAMAVKETVAIN